jgi:hypothetical protein
MALIVSAIIVITVVSVLLRERKGFADLQNELIPPIIHKKSARVLFPTK